MAEPWESAKGTTSKAGPQPWESATVSAPPKKGGVLESLAAGVGNILPDITSVTNSAAKDLSQTADRVIGDRVRKVMKGDFSGTGSPGQYQPAVDMKDALDLGGSLVNYATAPINGLVHAATMPFERPANAALVNSGRVVPTISTAPQKGSVLPKINVDSNISPEQSLQNMDSAVGTVGGIASMALGNEAGATRTIPRVGQAPRVRPTLPAIPTVDDLRAAKTAAYQQADNVGAVYHPAAVTDMIDATTQAMQARRLNPNLAPVSSNLLTELQGMRGRPASFNDLEEMRQLVGESVGPTASPREKMYAGMIRSNIDDFLNNAGPQAMLAGDPVAQGDAINNARQANVTYRKAEAIQNALNRADLQAASTGTGGNIDNATRQKLRGLLLDRKMSWTPDERQALELVVRGGPVQNLLRLVGRLSPEGNGLMMAGHLAAALPTHGLSAVGALAGAGSKIAAERMTENNVNNVLRTVTGTTRPVYVPRASQVFRQSLSTGRSQRAIAPLGALNAANDIPTIPFATPPLLTQAAAEPQDQEQNNTPY